MRTASSGIAAVLIGGTGGRFRAPVHRVQAQHAFDRCSLVSFWAPDYDTLLPDPKHGSILTGEYYLKRNAFLD